MFMQKTHRLYVEEIDVTTVLGIINRHQSMFGNNHKLVGDCGWSDDPTKWFITFYTSDKKWGRIAADMSEIGQLNVKVTPGGTTELYFTRG